jgi:hypothetical protein
MSNRVKLLKLGEKNCQSNPGTFCSFVTNHRFKKVTTLIFSSTEEIVFINHQSSIVIHPFFFINHQSSIIHYQSSIIIHQSSIINHHSSIINHQSSMISHQSSIIIISHQSSIITHNHQASKWKNFEKPILKVFQFVRIRGVFCPSLVSGGVQWGSNFCLDHTFLSCFQSKHAT